MSRTGTETIICLSPNFLYVFLYVCTTVKHQNQLMNGIRTAEQNFNTRYINLYFSENECYIKYAESVIF